MEMALRVLSVPGLPLNDLLPPGRPCLWCRAVLLLAHRVQTASSHRFLSLWSGCRRKPSLVCSKDHALLLGFAFRIRCYLRESRSCRSLWRLPYWAFAMLLLLMEDGDSIVASLGEGVVVEGANLYPLVLQRVWISDFPVEGMPGEVDRGRYPPSRSLSLR
ncbi:hypothetical protein IWZ01DRAFT_117187 [Phyllosticta capitalensis]